MNIITCNLIYFMSITYFRVLTQRIQELEKDLLYFKRANRELKKKLRDTISRQQDQKTPSAEPSSAKTEEQLSGTYNISRQLSDLQPSSAKPQKSSRTEGSTRIDEVTSQSGPKLAPVRVNRKELKQLR